MMTKNTKIIDDILDKIEEYSVEYWANGIIHFYNDFSEILVDPETSDVSVDLFLYEDILAEYGKDTILPNQSNGHYVHIGKCTICQLHFLKLKFS